MSESPHKLIKFWQELKRRKVFSVVTTYAATAYIVIEVINNLAFPLNLPSWIATLVLIILAIGLPVVIVLSWVFDLTPKGIEKTVSLEESESKKITTKPVKGKLRASYVLNAVLIIVVIVLAYPKIFHQDSLEKLRSSGKSIAIAVMSFQNLTNDDAKNFWQEMIQNDLITTLSNFEELKVRQPESLFAILQKSDLTNFASITPTFARTISQKLNASVFIIGNINQIDTIIRLNAKLINSETEEVIKSFQIDGPVENILDMTDSLSVAVTNFLILTFLKTEIPPSVHSLVGSTRSPEALRKFIDGQKVYMEMNFPLATEMFQAAIKIDSNFTIAKVMLAILYLNQGMVDEAKKCSISSYERRDQLSRMDKISSEWCYSVCFGTPNETLRYLRNALEIDDQQPGIHYNIGVFYNIIYQYDKAIVELKKSLEIFKKWGIKPMWVNSYLALGFAYQKSGEYKKAEKLYKRAEEDFPDNIGLIFNQAVLALSEGKTKDAEEYIKKYKSIQEDNSWPEVAITADVASIYSEANILDGAEKYYRKALSLEPDNPILMNNLAYFLIDKDRNINEGLELIDKIPAFYPDNYSFLYTKGWGLYKQGKYQESLEILQKSWDLRREKAIYDHAAFLHLEAAKKAIAN